MKNQTKKRVVKCLGLFFVAMTLLVSCSKKAKEESKSEESVVKADEPEMTAQESRFKDSLQEYYSKDNPIVLVDGNDLRKVDEDLANEFSKIYKEIYYEQVGAINGIVYRKLMQYTSKYPQTLNYDFKKTQKAGVNITTSADGKFRIYSWDTKTGGTMKFFDGIIQYQGADKVFSKGVKYPNVVEGDDPMPGRYYKQIFSLDSNGVKAYIVNFLSIFSSFEYSEGVQLFRIENNALNDTLKLIKTKSGLHNELVFPYDFYSTLQTKLENTDLVQYDASTNTISIPVVRDDLKVTENRIKYKFTGEYFEKQ